MSPNVLVLWLLSMGVGEGHHSGQTPLGEIQGGGLVWPLGSLEQEWLVLLVRVLVVRRKWAQGNH